MNVLLLASHGIAEYDDVRMFSRLGYDVFCPGGYADPKHPGETLRPAIPEAPDHPDLRVLCDKQREKHAAEPADWAIDWAKADLHPELVDWADVIICHHFPERWIAAQWARIKHKRVIWRTCGQSNPQLEQLMGLFRRDGLQIVRYSPNETAFGPDFAGEDALIRFGKYPDDYGPWAGDGLWVGNVTQHMLERGDATGLSFWLAATRDLPARPAGPGSERLPGGVGALDYDAMREYLRHCRVYLYTGTFPASYTLGLIEALMTGVPVMSITRQTFGTPLFEGDALASWIIDTPQHAREVLPRFLDKDLEQALNESRHIRQAAIDTFGMDAVGPLWVQFLGAPAMAVAA